MRALAAILLLTASAWGQAAKTVGVTMPSPSTTLHATPISQGTFTGLEKFFNQRLANLFDAADPFDLLGNTRGVYLDGYGAVFTTEASLLITPTVTPFRKTITKELADSVRRRKQERLPFLKAAMKEMMVTMAKTFLQVPPTEQMVLIVRFYYESWEDMNGMPSQVTMRGSRKAVLAGDIQVEQQ